jgi:uncharacterized coiled-coil DUF342 family protein
MGEPSGEIQNSPSNLETMFTRLKELNEVRQKSISKIKALISELSNIRDLKNKKTEIVKQNKEKRNSITKELQKLLGELKPIKEEKDKFGEIGSPKAIQARIDAIEWSIITGDIPFKKEQELTKERLLLEEKLEKALQRYSIQKDENSLIDKINDLRTEQRLFHSNVIANSSEWEKLDKQIKETIPKLDKLRTDLKPVEEEIMQIRSQIGESKGKAQEEERTSKRRYESDAQRTVSAKFAELKERFKKKKKLTTDDLLILQSVGEDLPLD